MRNPVGLAISTGFVQSEVTAQIDNADVASEEAQGRLPRGSVGKCEEGEIDIRNPVRVVGVEDPLREAEMGVDFTQRHPGGSVGAQMPQLEVRVSIDEADELTAGVAGSSEYGDRVGHDFLGRTRVEREYTHMR
jgi:hypothetical protein